MRIIGKSSGGYLVEMSEDEVCVAAGHSSIYSSPWNRAGIPLGTTIDFVAGTAKLKALAAADEKRKQSASVLRALADLIDQIEPTKIEEPKPEPPADPEPPTVAVAT